MQSTDFVDGIFLDQITQNCTKGSRFLSGQIAQDLDFYRIRQTISGFASSAEGADFLLKREPTENSQTVAFLKSLGSDWDTFLHSTRQPPVHAASP